MYTLTDRDQTAEKKLEIIMENLASRKIDALQAKEMITRIVERKDNTNRKYPDGCKKTITELIKRTSFSGINMNKQNRNSKQNIPKRLLPLILLIQMIVSCEMTSSAGDDSDTSSSSSSSTTSSIDTSEYSESVATSSSSTYNSADILSARTFSGIIYIDLDSFEAGTDTSYGSDFSSGSVTFSDYGVTISGEDADELCISSECSIKFVLTGSSDCTLYIESSDDFQLYLDDVEIETEDGPALIIDSDVRTFITSADGSSNTLSDASDRDDISGKGALCSEGTLIFGGEGELTVNGSYKHGILCDQYIRVTEGTINVNVSERDAIRSTDGFYF